ncbi:MAG: flavin reductase family protein [Firmicutes bacterium]|nr:flavin reductase family protein [Bacillota bacterium]
MRKNYGKKPLIFPQPVLIIGTYNDDGTPDLMNAAWGAVGDDHQVFLCLSPGHKTTENILKRKAFTVAMATEDQLVPCDYVGIVSGNDVPDKVEKSGLHTVKADVVDAPRVEELPICIECTLESYEDVHCHLFGNIENVTADESVLTDGKVDPAKLRPIMYDIENHLYWGFGKPAGKAFSDGRKLDK